MFIANSPRPVSVQTQSRARTSYHTGIKLAYRLDQLPPETVASIPRSTRHAWRALRPTDFFGGSDTDAAALHPSQLLASEVSRIRQYLTNPDFATWTAIAIYFQMLRDGVIRCALSTFYETARWLGLSRRQKRRARPKKPGVRATAVGQIIHTDITHTRLVDGTRVYIYNVVCADPLVVDNRSRYWLASYASLTKSAVENRENIERVLAEHAARWPDTLELWVDDGAENAGALLALANDSGGRIRHMVAQRTVRFSNSMVEAINRVLKSTYLRERRFEALDGLQQFLNAARTDYNARPHGALFGLRPEEVLAGTLPDSRRFLGSLAEARTERVAGNRAFDCKACRESDGAAPSVD